MSISASFSGKLYGMRSGKNKIVKDKVKRILIDALYFKE
jgi:predicted site-specific integrase-resolvase